MGPTVFGRQLRRHRIDDTTTSPRRSEVTCFTLIPDGSVSQSKTGEHRGHSVTGFGRTCLSQGVTPGTHNPPRLSGNAVFTAVFEVLGTLAENPTISTTVWYRSPYNGRVFFDPLGWPVAEAWLHRQPRRATANNPAVGRRRIRPSAKRAAGLCPRRE